QALGLLLRIVRRSRGFLGEHLLETLGREEPLFAPDVGLRGIARGVALLVALPGAAIVAGLLVHLRGDAEIPRLYVCLGRARPVLFLRVDGPGGIRVARLLVQLGRFGEAILIVTDFR